MAPMRVYYDRDADVNLIKGKKVLVVGYGSQGHAHAMNLRDSGVKDVRIALKPGSATIKKAEAVGFTDMSPGSSLAFAHGLSLHFSLITPRNDTDVFMIAPKGPGHTVRSEYVRGGG